MSPAPNPFLTKLPILQARTMKEQGLSNNQIVENLQRDGFTSQQILDALHQIELKGGVEMNQPPPMQPPQNPAQQAPPAASFSSEMAPANEELIEAIIDEKWNDLMKDINRIIEWKSKTDANITAIEQQFKDLKDNFDKLHNAVIAKVGEYDKNILDVGNEIKALEKVFSKVIPTFTDNVNELSRITEKLGKE